MQSPYPLELSDPAASDVGSTHPELNGNALVKSETTSTELAKAEVRLSDPRAEALRQMLERHRGTRQLIILQDFPDPDALSSAWIYKLIAEQFEIQCDIAYAAF